MGPVLAPTTALTRAQVRSQVRRARYMTANRIRVGVRVPGREQYGILSEYGERRECQGPEQRLQ